MTEAISGHRVPALFPNQLLYSHRLPGSIPLNLSTMAASQRTPDQRDGGFNDKDYDVEQQASHDEVQRNALTNTVTLSSEMFENLYLSPKNRNATPLTKQLANPTPVAIMGFVVGLTPLSCDFMTWRGSGGFGVATGTASIFFGGVLLTIAGIGEFILGNTFPFIVFMGYGAHFLTYSTTFLPFFNAIAYFNPEAPVGPDQITPTFAASYGKTAYSPTFDSRD